MRVWLRFMLVDPRRVLEKCKGKLIIRSSVNGRLSVEDVGGGFEPRASDV